MKRLTILFVLLSFIGYGQVNLNNNTWLLNSLGIMDASQPYIHLSDTTTRLLTSVTTAYAIKYNQIELNSGSTLVDSTKITVTYSGLYLLQFSAIFQSSAPNKMFNIWTKTNGVTDERSGTSWAMIGTSNSRVVTTPLIVNLTAGQYIELYMWSDDTGAKLIFTPRATTPTRASSPSIIVTMNKISK